MKMKIWSSLYSGIKLLSITITALSLLAVSACGQKGASGATDPAPVTETAPIQHNTDGWSQERKTTSDSAVVLTKSEMPKEQQDYWRNEYKQTDLIQVPADPKHNVMLFKVRNVPEWADTIFIAPKVMAYTSAQMGRLAPLANNDGTTTLTFPFVITDATAATVTAPNAIDAVAIPDSIRVRDLNALQSDLNAQFGREQKLMTLSGCPKKIIIRENGQDHDVTPVELRQGDYCQINAPMSASLTLPTEKTQYILQQALYANAVDIRAEYETRVAFAVSRFTLEFDRQKLFDDLEASISVNAGVWADIDLHAKVTEVVKRQSFKLHMQGDMNGHLDAIVDQAIKLFFEQYRPDPATGLKACGPAVVCARLNYNHSKEQQSLNVTWEQSSNAMTGQNYLTWTKLQPLMDKEVTIGIGKDRPPVRNRGGEVETGLTVVPGDLVEVTPSYIDKETREYSKPTTTHQPHSVCIRNENIMGYKCHMLGHGGGSDCDNVVVGQRCVESQDQGTNTTTYSNSDATFIHMDQPIGETKQLLDGLALKFKWTNKADGKERSVTCPMALFSRIGNGQSLQVRIENQPTCNVFDKDASSSPMMYLA